MLEKVTEIHKDIKRSRDEVIEKTPIKKAIDSAYSIGQRFLNKIKLAAKSNEWVSSMPIGKEDFYKLQDAVKKMSIKSSGEVASNSEVLPDILFIDLDAELSPDVPLYRIDKAELRLKMYPKAKEMLKIWKRQYQEKHIVLLTSDWEVLSSLKVRKVKAILPSQSLMKNVIGELDPARSDVLEKVRLVNALKIDEKHQVLIQTLDEGVRAIRNIFKIPETII